MMTLNWSSGKALTRAGHRPDQPARIRAMFAMQYGFDLPSTFDMQSLRERIALRGPLFDDLAGLHAKVFLVAETPGRAHRYTPFYLWQDLDAMTDFLLSDKFQGVQASFGRPVVSTWNQLAYVEGGSMGREPTVAIQQAVDLPRGIDLKAACGQAAGELAALRDAPGLHSAFLGLDAAAWRWMSISLWRAAPADPVAGQAFEILHLSAPGLRSGPRGT